MNGYPFAFLAVNRHQLGKESILIFDKIFIAYRLTKHTHNKKISFLPITPLAADLKMLLLFIAGILEDSSSCLLTEAMTILNMSSSVSGVE